MPEAPLCLPTTQASSSTLFTRMKPALVHHSYYSKSRIILRKPLVANSVDKSHELMDIVVGNVGVAAKLGVRSPGFLVLPGVNSWLIFQIEIMQT